jgi:hypothetical protein
MLSETHIRALQNIRTIEDLLEFLRDELNWPLPEDAVENITFTYQPADLGLKSEHAPKINGIYQVRPIRSDQPWGIFFIDFENKKIPLTILRRIVNHLVAKRRQNVTATGRQWELGDLLFMSMYGEVSEGMRDVAFAHFHQHAGDLPTLQVIDWHADDTPAALRTTYETLKSNLNWPSDPANKEQWRKKWSGPFRHGQGYVITTAKGLAEALAALSRNIRRRCSEVLEAETESGPMTKLYKAFQSALIHDLTPDGFADTFAQTITYGLFSGAVSRRHPEEQGSKSLTTDTISQIVPETSPFLREVMETFIDVGGRKSGFDFDEVGVQDVVELLRSDDTDMRAILDDFGSRRQGEDPVIHFYEDYLAAYDKPEKKKRGVFYTPQPVVSYIVRSVHELLQTEFNLSDGLASTITWREMAERGTLSPRERVGDGSSAGVRGYAEPELASDQPTLLGIPATQPSLGDSQSSDTLAPRERVGDGSSAGVRGHVATQSATGSTPHPNPSPSGEGPGIAIPDGTDPDSPFVVILDPATGTATFLVEVIDVIHKQLQEKWVTEGADACKALLRNPHSDIGNSFREFWNAYVPDHLLPRLYGYELMMAPYAIAHLKIGLKLRDTGFDFATLKATDRVGIYLTNALEPAQPLQPSLPLMWPALAHEAMAVKSVKETQRFTVVIGNPPYSGVSSNMTPAAQRIVDAYKIIDGAALDERKLWLQDDYVKFLRTAQTTVERTGTGILGFITNHGYLENPTFRGMRQSLIATFNLMQFIDLHGNANKKERSPNGGEDDNVFDIRQGVAICLAAQLKSRSFASHTDLWGSRDSKSAWLGTHSIKSTPSATLTPDSPFYFLRPQIIDSRAEYDGGWNVADIMPANCAGFVTARDHFVIDIDQEALLDRIGDFRDPAHTDAEIRSKYFEGMGSDKYPDGDSRGWKLPEARLRLQADPQWRDRVQWCLYRPFDFRPIYWTTGMVDWPRPQVMRNMLQGPNRALAISKSVEIGRFEHVLCTNRIIGHHSVSLKEVNYILPLHRYPTEKEAAMGILKEPNLCPAFLDSLAGITGRELNLKLPPEDQDTVRDVSFSPEDVFHYIYALLHSPTYRSRYKEFLKFDFPRIPLPGCPEVFDALLPLGAGLVALHLMESPALNHPITTFVGNDSASFTEMATAGPRVEKVSFTPLPSEGEGPGVRGTVWIDKAKTQGFRGVPEAVWNFHIGGYQVCEKWLKDRGPKKGNPGRILTPEDVTHYHRIVVALNETIRIMAEIDEAIEEHGGWPGAFKS